MKNKLIVSTLLIGSALAFGACSKDKKPAPTDPAATAPATTTDPAKADPAAPGAPAKPDDKASDKPAAGGW